MDPIGKENPVQNTNPVHSATQKQIKSGINAALSRSAEELITAVGRRVVDRGPVDIEQLAYTIDCLADRSSEMDRSALKRKAKELRNGGYTAYSNSNTNHSLVNTPLQSPSHNIHSSYETPEKSPKQGPGNTPMSVLSRNSDVEDIPSPIKLPMGEGYSPERHRSHPAPGVINRLRSAGMDADQITASLDAQRLPPNEQVDYFSLKYTKTLKVEFSDGLAMWQGLRLGSEAAKNKEEHGRGELIGVAARGHFYLHAEKPAGAGLSQKHVHHSSFFAGREVSAAFKLSASNGVINKISNDSGHHKPGLEHLLYMCDLLKAQMRENDLNKLQVTYIQPSKENETMNVEAFFKQYRENNTAG